MIPSPLSETPDKIQETPLYSSELEHQGTGIATRGGNRNRTPPNRTQIGVQGVSMKSTSRQSKMDKAKLNSMPANSSARTAGIISEVNDETTQSIHSSETAQKKNSELNGSGGISLGPFQSAIPFVTGEATPPVINPAIFTPPGFHTVNRLCLSKELTAPETTSIYEACKRMVVTRVDAQLVADSKSLLCGILTDKVELKEGPLDQFTDELESFLRKQGMPVRLNKGMVELVGDFVVCEEGKPISPEASRILVFSSLSL